MDHPSPLPEPSISTGIIARQDRTGYLVLHEDGEAFVRAHDIGAVVGDRVELSDGRIARVLPRRNAILRAAPDGEARAQAIAANVDLLLIVAAADAPWNARRVERYQAIAAAAHARAVLAVNKADRGDLAPPGALRVSAATGDGLDALRALLSGRTAAIVGPSGVGKTSLVNALLGIAEATSPVRASDGKGRHTTSARHLHAIPGGGWIIDTPGTRELGLVDPEGVDDVFAEIAALAPRCKFRDCAHDTEPGCAVRSGVDPERLAAWRKLRREAEGAARRADARASRAAERAGGRTGRDAFREKRDRYR